MDSTSAEMDEKVARADMRRSFIAFMENFENKPASIQLYGQTPQEINFGSMQSSVLHYAVKDFATPTGTMEHSILRTSDTVFIAIPYDGSQPSLMFESTGEYFRKAFAECRLLVDMYMIDYFVDDLWSKIPTSWQRFYETELENIGSDRLAMVQLVKFILRHPNGRGPSNNTTSSPEPLSMLALRAVVANVELGQWNPIQKPTDFLTCIGLEPRAGDKTEFTVLREKLPPALRLKIKTKKEHEVARIADIVELLLDHLPECGVDEIVDAGAGIGHLSRILSLLLSHNVSTIEGDPTLVDTASRIDDKITRSLKHLSKKTAEMDAEWSTPGRKAMFIKEQHEIGDCAGRNLLLTGLHTCGDFSATILRHFCNNDDAKVLLHFGCCYHKLNGGKDKFYRDVYEGMEVIENAANQLPGFPLSQAFAHLKLSYAAREVACFGHEQFLQKLDNSVTKTAFFVNCYRAILEWIVLDCPSPSTSTAIDETLRHQGLRGFRGAESMEFWQYANEALKDKPNMRVRFEEILEKRPTLRDEVNVLSKSEAGKTLLLYAFRLLVAPMIEALILMDRVAFLKEHGYKSTFLVPVFDPMLSPRNVALVSWK